MRHLIIMSSSYSSGCRIALDFCPGELKTNEFERAIVKIKDVCGADVSISSHSIEAEGAPWQDVGKADMFFADVKLIKTLDEFISLVKADRKLTGWDVAKYILSKCKCTHLNWKSSCIWRMQIICAQQVGRDCLKTKYWLTSMVLLLVQCILNVRNSDMMRYTRTDNYSVRESMTNFR